MEFECCVDSVVSAQAAVKGGAHRLELCSSLIEGGISCSLGTLIEIRKQFPDVFITCLVRPRAGDFVYTADEVSIMIQDIILFKQFGANGIVIGALTKSNTIDEAVMKLLIAAGVPLEITFHRAIDFTCDVLASLSFCCTLGVHRVLSSGGRETCLLGSKLLQRMTQQKSVMVCAGGGVTEENAREIVAKTGVRQLHGSLREKVVYTHEGPYKLCKEPLMVTSKERVQQLLENISNCRGGVENT